MIIIIIVVQLGRMGRRDIGWGGINYSQKSSLKTILL